MAHSLAALFSTMNSKMSIFLLGPIIYYRDTHNYYTRSTTNGSIVVQNPRTKSLKNVVIYRAVDV